MITNNIKDSRKVFLMYTAFNSASRKTGGTRRFQELMEGLLLRNTVHLFAPLDANFIEHPNLIKHGIKIFKMRFLPQGFINLLANFSTLLKAHRIQYDFFIVFSLPYAIQCALLGIKNIVFLPREDFIRSRELSLAENTNPAWIKNIIVNIFLIIERIALLRAKYIITQSKLDRDSLLARHSQIRTSIISKFRILNNNVNPSWIKTREFDHQVNLDRNILGPSSNRSIQKKEKYSLIFIGNLNDKKKGLQILIPSIIRLNSEGYNIELKIVGDGRLFGSMTAKYQDLSFLRFMGFRADPSIDLVASDLLIVPSFTDSFPNVILEALFHEIPVVGSKVGGIPEMLYYEELLFSPSEDEIYSKIKDILDNNLFSHYQKLCIRRKRFLTFDWVERFEAIVNS